MALIGAGTLIGVIVTFLLAIYAFRKQQLTEGGTIAAIVVGIAVFVLGGWTWLALLMVFFISSNFWSKFKAEKKEEAIKEFAKAGIRDFWQVSANGLSGSLLAAAYFVSPTNALFAAFAGTIATVTADTWATEIGVLDKNPRSILTGKRAKPGTSGAISLLGLVATVGACLLIALCAIAFNSINNGFENHLFLGDVVKEQFVGGLAFILIVIIAGTIGSLSDSVLGATVQGTYYCRKCRKETEKTMHGCGHKTELSRGFRIIDNDAVNFLSSAIGALAGFALASALL